MRRNFTLTPGIAWLRRLAKVTCRKGQVWTRPDLTVLIVVGEPEPSDEWDRHGRFIDHVSNVLKTLSQHGWCHLILCLETGEHCLVNERFFAEGEQNLITNTWTRIA